MAVVILHDDNSHSPPRLDYSFDFTVKNYHRVAVGKVVLSQIFTQDGDSWQLRLKKLRRRSRKTGRLQMECQLELITLNPYEKCKLARVISYNWDVNNTKSALFTKTGENREFCGADVEIKIDRGDLKLTVEVITCVQPDRTIEYPKSQMFTAKVSKWFESEDFGDTIMVAADGMKFRCHRDILSARSDVFNLMFTSPMKESKENLVEIEDFDGQIVAAMLQFVYSDECTQVGPMADRLYAIAHRYQLYRLQNLCESALAANLSENSVVTKTQQLAELYDLDELKLQCDAYWESQNGGRSTSPGCYDSDEPLELDSKFRFTADNFQRWPVGKVLLSQPFFMWSSWQLKLTKTGKNQVRCQLQLVDERDEWKFPQIATVRLVDNTREDFVPLVCFYRSGDKYDFGTFYIESSTNRLKVEVEVVEWEDSHIFSYTSSASDMASEVLDWIKSEDFGDTTVVAKDGKKFRCHRDIVARRSEDFLTDFGWQAKKKRKTDENVIEIRCSDGDVVAALLQYFYTDQVDQNGLSIADRLYEGADDYNLDRLKLICEFAMADSLSVESVMKVYRLATIYRLDKLLAVCVDYLDTHKAELNIGEIMAEAVQIGEDKANGE